MITPVATAHPVPGARSDARARRRQCRETMPRATSVTPTTPNSERRSSKMTNAQTGHEHDAEGPRATGYTTGKIARAVGAPEREEVRAECSTIVAMDERQGRPAAGPSPPRRRARRAGRGACRSPLRTRERREDRRATPARLASAFQPAWITAAARTNPRATGLTASEYGLGRKPSKHSVCPLGKKV
jgi:hypothetical protein